MRTPKRDNRPVLARRNKAEDMTVGHNGRQHVTCFLRMDVTLLPQLKPNLFARVRINCDSTFLFETKVKRKLRGIKSVTLLREDTRHGVCMGCDREQTISSEYEI